MNRLVTPLILIGAFVSCPFTGQAASLDTNFTESVVLNDAANIGGATDLLWAPDGSNRLFIIRKDGQIRIMKNGVLNATPFATVSPVYTSSECGLNGICFDPNFVVNRYVYRI